MKLFRTVLERQADQARDRERLAEHAKQFAGKLLGEKNTPHPAKTTAPPSTSPSQATGPVRPWANVRAGQAGLKFYARSEGNTEMRAQPWAQGLVSTLLHAADQGGVHLCLVWPIRFDSLVILHALANIERNFVRDLRGMRTLLYPGTYSSRAALQGALADRA